MITTYLAWTWVLQTKVTGKSQCQPWPNSEHTPQKVSVDPKAILTLISQHRRQHRWHLKMMEDDQEDYGAHSLLRKKGGNG